MMGLLDMFKNKGEKTPHKCYRCGKEFTGFFNGSKLKDGEYICSDCTVYTTKLMDKKDVVNKDFRYYDFDSKQMNRYLEYREKDKERAEKFVAEEEYLNGELLVDRSRMWFKLKNYEEIFLVQQIDFMAFVVRKEDKEYIIGGNIALKGNWIYSKLPLKIKYSAGSLFHKVKDEDILMQLEEFHTKVRPQAGIVIG